MTKTKTTRLRVGQTKHVPVMLEEAIDLMDPKEGGVYVDSTLGGGGHFLKLIERAKKGIFIGIDQDQEAIDRVASQLDQQKSEHQKVILKQSNFENIAEILKEAGVKKVDAILADLGTSQDQLEAEGRGFSFLLDEPLDMRMDMSTTVTAADLLNGLSRRELIELFNKLADLYGISNKLVEKIVTVRQERPILTTKQLTDLIRQAVQKSTRTNSVGSLMKTPKYGDKLEARVFQALRIAVNHELYSLKQFLPKAFETLDANGKLVVISFHSGEDRIVKDFFKEKVNQKQAIFIEKLLLPGADEIVANQRSSSAKLRVIQKI